MNQKKIKSREEIAFLVKKFKQQGKKIGFTSGVFDLIHAGHIDFFSKCSQRCDIFIIGLNSDESVKRYKGENRPIISEKYRLFTLSAIESVDYIFPFSERRNQQNIEIIQPDYYFKAGDYSKSQLTSAEIIEKHGGSVEIIPIEHNISTTEIIKKIMRIHQNENPVIHHQETNSSYLPLPAGKKKPAIFIDRDGTINEEIEYLHEPERFQLISQAAEGLKKFQDMGYYIIIITTQAGIGLGYFSHEDFYKVNKAMFKALKNFSVKIDKIYYCPHSITENCSCRKPKTALFEQAAKDLNIDIKNSYMIGDKTSDIQAGKNFQLRTILVNTGHKGNDQEYETKPDFIADNLVHAAELILNQERKESKE